ncbi:MAG: PAS domain S-box protein, partial [Terriglobales bacterium]
MDWSRDLVEHSHDLLCIHDLDGRLLSVNPVAARMLGYTVEEILKVPMRELVDPKVRDQFDRYLQQIASAGEATGILAVLTRSGQRRFWEYHCTLRTEGVEKPLVRGIAYDVTDRSRAEKALRESSQKLVATASGQELLLRGLQLFRTLLDNSNDAIEVVDPATMQLLDINEKSCIDLGYSRDELLSMTIFDIDPQLTPDILENALDQLCKHGFVTLERTHRRKDGTTFPVEVNTRLVLLDKEYFVAISRDITERKIRDGRLQEYERVLESLDEMIVVVNREHRYVLANRAFLRYRGMTEEQVFGRHIT